MAKVINPFGTAQFPGGFILRSARRFAEHRLRRRLGRFAGRRRLQKSSGKAPLLDGGVTTVSFCKVWVPESFFKSLRCGLIYGNKILSADRIEMEIFRWTEIRYTFMGKPENSGVT
ncbi:MAG: hypothetical protein LBU98_03090 [Alistipes sp.]|jgi:hypothetical protein|nr:hypothetical protein [Alistipes sp.]